MNNDIIKDIKSINILSSKNVFDFRNYISFKYQKSTPKVQAEILADAIKKTISGRIPKVEKSLKINLSDNIIKTAVNRGSFDINSMDVVIEYLNLKFDLNEDTFLSVLCNWLNEITSENIDKENIKQFIQNAYNLDVKHYNEETLSTVLENIIQAEFIDSSAININDNVFEKDYKIFQTVWIYKICKRILETTQKSIYSSSLILKNKVKMLNIKEFAIGISLIILIFSLKINAFGNNTSNNTNNVKNDQISIQTDISTNKSNSLETLLLKNYHGSLEKTEIKSDDKIKLNFTNKKKLTMKATAYDLSIECCGKPRNHPMYGITSSGTKATKGRTVAVDSSVIPLESKLYIQFPKPYGSLDGIYIAEDTGRKVKGNIIDIFLGEDKIGESIVHEKADNFGIQMVDVFLIS